jgi:hypothetical protein
MQAKMAHRGAILAPPVTHLGNDAAAPALG